MKKIYILAFLFCMGSQLLRAQHDAMYTQYMFNPLLINPAYAGSADALDVTVLNRNQWVGFDGAPRTSTFSAHSPLKDNRINFGLTVTDDHFGLSHQDKISLIYAYRISFRHSALFLGVQGGINMVRTNLSPGRSGLLRTG
jgi:type IX secretion system PorP/SprF family membrane protein